MTGKIHENHKQLDAICGNKNLLNEAQNLRKKGVLQKLLVFFL